MNYSIIADLHTHTLFSGHAFSTVEENIAAAKKAGLKYLAITDYYYDYRNFIDHENEIGRMVILEKRIKDPDLILIQGAELNLNQQPPQAIIEKCRWRPIGLHSWFLKAEEATLHQVETLFREAILSGVATHFCHIERDLQHIDHGQYEEELCADIKSFLTSLVYFSYSHNIPLELNEYSLYSNHGNNSGRIEYWLSIAKDLGCVIYLGSDSHYSGSVGQFELCKQMLSKVGYPPELIINCNENLIHKYVLKEETNDG